jgi:hypothetical protein
LLFLQRNDITAAEIFFGRRMFYSHASLRSCVGSSPNLQNPMISIAWEGG